MKKWVTGWDKIFANHISKNELVSRIHKELWKLSSKKSRKKRGGGGNGGKGERWKGERGNWAPCLIIQEVPDVVTWPWRSRSSRRRAPQGKQVSACLTRAVTPLARRSLKASSRCWRKTPTMDGRSGELQVPFCNLPEETSLIKIAATQQPTQLHLCWISGPLCPSLATGISSCLSVFINFNLTWGLSSL